MARKKRRKDRITKAAKEVWARYACPRSIILDFNVGMMRVISHYRDKYHIKPEVLRGVAADHGITVDELRIALAPRLLQDKLDQALEG